MSTQGSSKATPSERGSRPGEAYGVASITNVLEGLRFPVRKEELLQRYGDRQIQWTKDSQPMRLRDCLQQVGRNEFNNITELASIISEQVGKGQRGTR